MAKNSQTISLKRPFQGTRTEFLRCIIDILEASDSSIRKTIVTHTKLHYAISSDNFRMKKITEYLLKYFNISISYFFKDDEGNPIPVPPKYEKDFLGFLRGAIKYRKKTLDRIAYEINEYVENIKYALMKVDDMDLDLLLKIATVLQLNLGVKVNIPYDVEAENNGPTQDTEFSPSISFSASMEKVFNVDGQLARKTSIGRGEYSNYVSRTTKNESGD